MNPKLLRICMLICAISMSNVIVAQNKLSRNQILNAVREHQHNTDFSHIAVGDSVLCDSATTKITLDIKNDSIAHNYPYRLIFTKENIEVDIYNEGLNMYRSTFEYDDLSYDKLKIMVNECNLKKIDSHDDTILNKENYILSLYQGNKIYMSIERYNGRTNVTTGFYDLVSEIKKLVPDISSVISVCEDYGTIEDTLSIDCSKISLEISEETLRFRSKGGEFKKIEVTCSDGDWEILEYPDWINISKNNNNEIIFESVKNETKSERSGIVRVGSFGIIKEIYIIQK